MRVLGIDGCRQGWVGIALTDGAFAGAYLSSRLAELTGIDGYAAVGVDIPLGLLASGWRMADAAAASSIGPRRQSVFPTPPRGVLASATYAEANSLCRELTGAGLSRQAYGLFEKVREADALWTAGHGLYEVHPEVSFAQMNGGPVAYAKTTWAGLCLRRELLAEAGISVPSDIGSAGWAKPDDVLDAAAVAWTAQRIALGEAGRVPDVAQLCDHGRPIAIWY